MSDIIGSLYDNQKKKIDNFDCPLCKDKQWFVSSSLTTIIDVEKLPKLLKDTYPKPKVDDMIRIECKNCGYTAHLNFSTLQRMKNE